MKNSITTLKKETVWLSQHLDEKRLGRVKFYLNNKNWGFIIDIETGVEIFFYKNKIKYEKDYDIKLGDYVTFIINHDGRENRMQAVEIEISTK